MTQYSEYKYDTIVTGLSVFLCIYIAAVVGPIIYFYSTLRPATCLNYIDCPWNEDLTSKLMISGGSRCVTTIDLTSQITFPAKWEQSSQISSQLLAGNPISCWTDGLNVTIHNPLAVMLPLVIFAIVLFVTITLLILLAPNRQKFQCSPCLFLILCCIIGVGFFILLIIYAVYATQWAPGTCLNYTWCNGGNEKIFRDGVYCVYYAINNHTAPVVMSIASGSMFPAGMPNECWANTSSVMFYNPAQLIGYGAAVAIGSVTFLLAMMYYMARKNPR